MRHLLLAALLIPGVTLGESLTAAQAAGKAGETVTVEFRVRSTGANAAGYEELYSEASWRHPDAFFIRLPAGTETARYAGRSVRATGKVEVVQFAEGRRMAISLRDAGEVAVLDPLPPFTPTESYAVRTIRGFTVLVHPAVLQQPANAEQAFAELASQLDTIAAVVPAQSLAAVRQVRIWLEWKAREDAAAEFHPSRAWLLANGYNPEKAGHVEISNLGHWVAWSRRDQPMSLLHEFAHAYHHLVLGEGHAAVRQAYDHAMKAGLYEAVPYVHGGSRTAYATKNPTEYFAELTEAYFGRNDYYPFTRADLLRHDPVGYRLVERVWNVTAGSRF